MKFASKTLKMQENLWLDYDQFMSTCWLSSFINLRFLIALQFQGMPTPLIDRWRAVIQWEDQTAKDISEIARSTGLRHCHIKKWVTRYHMTGDVQDNPRSGRPRILQKKDLAQVRNLVLKRKCLTAADVASKLEATASPSTIKRELHREGFDFNIARCIPFISESQRQARLNFSKKHYKTPWSRVLFTDSSIFYLKPSQSSSKVKYWGLKGSHAKQHYSRDGRKVHVYGGASNNGLTPLMFVTGTTGMKSEFIDKRSKKPFRGVCAAEYQKLLKEHFVREGDKLFRKGTGKWADNWIFQQDGASSHTAGDTKLLLRQLMGGRVIEDWPANSPDLSWIENLWALVDRRLRKGEYRDIAEFKAAIVKIWSEIDIKICQNAVRGMANRFRTCIANNGGHIGK